MSISVIFCYHFADMPGIAKEDGWTKKYLTQEELKNGKILEWVPALPLYCVLIGATNLGFVLSAPITGVERMDAMGPRDLLLTKHLNITI